MTDNALYQIITSWLSDQLFNNASPGVQRRRSKLGVLMHLFTATGTDQFIRTADIQCRHPFCS